MCGGPNSVFAKLYEGTEGYILELSNNQIYQNKELKMINNFNNIDIGNTPFMSDTNQPWYNERGDIVEVRIVDKIAPLSTQYLFNTLINLKNIENIENIDTSYLTNMNCMFFSCKKLTEIKGLTITSNVNNIRYLLYGCNSLESIDLSNFDTSGVTTMEGMFSRCNVKTLDVSYLETENVKDMQSMFENCNNLETIIGLNSFNTANVNRMSGMFSYMGKLNSLDLTSFDTSNVSEMTNMFCNSSNLKTIYADKSKWKVAKYSSSMFLNCGTSEVTFI